MKFGIMSNLILASSSPYRRDLLARLGIQFECVTPDVDEAAERLSTKDPVALARSLALKKAQVVAALHKKAIVIGGDQVIALDDEVLGKPGTEAAAKLQLARLAGREHAVISALAVVRGNEVEEFADVAMIRMRPLSTAEIARYVALDKPLDCAGSYKIECAGIALLERITSSDQSAITGMPMLRLCEVLRQFGLQVP